MCHVSADFSQSTLQARRKMIVDGQTSFTAFRVYMPNLQDGKPACQVQKVTGLHASPLRSGLFLYWMPFSVFGLDISNCVD